MTEYLCSYCGVGGLGRNVVLCLLAKCRRRVRQIEDFTTSCRPTSSHFFPPHFVFSFFSCPPSSSPHTHSRLHTHNMGGSGKVDASIQAFFPPTPQSSPAKRPAAEDIGDGFTAEEIQVALQPKLPEPWQPPGKYTESDICDLRPGPKAVTFMGRVCNLFDVANTPKTPRSARGCVKLCVKDETGATTVRLWYAHQMPALRLGSLVSIWTTHSE